jgi:hypothetical protein
MKSGGFMKIKVLILAACLIFMQCFLGDTHEINNFNFIFYRINGSEYPIEGTNNQVVLTVNTDGKKGILGYNEYETENFKTQVIFIQFDSIKTGAFRISSGLSFFDYVGDWFPDTSGKYVSLGATSDSLYLEYDSIKKSVTGHFKLTVAKNMDTVFIHDGIFKYYL